MAAAPSAWARKVLPTPTGPIELLGAGQGEPVGQRGQQLAQLEATHEGGEVWLEGHPTTSRR